MIFYCKVLCNNWFSVSRIRWRVQSFTQCVEVQKCKVIVPISAHTVKSLACSFITTLFVGCWSVEYLLSDQDDCDDDHEERDECRVSSFESTDRQDLCSAYLLQSTLISIWAATSISLRIYNCSSRGISNWTVSFSCKSTAWSGALPCIYFHISIHAPSLIKNQSIERWTW